MYKAFISIIYKTLDKISNAFEESLFEFKNH